MTRLKYTGREDDGTGLYQYRARYYDPSLGRFISEDPLKFQAGVNFYAYVGHDPLDANDPSGLIGVGVLGGLGNIIKRFLPGPFAGEGVQLSGIGQQATAQVQRDINAAGAAGGCHLCGATDPGTQSGNWVLDHIPPTKLVNGQPQVGYPSCIGCSSAQGGYVCAATKSGAAGALAAGVLAGNAEASSGILGTGITWTDVKNFAVDVLTDPSTYYAPLMLLTPSSTGGCSNGTCSDMIYSSKPNNNQVQLVYMEGSRK